MKALLAAVVVACACAVSWGWQDKIEKPTIDVVFCIDCSGSMGGVIETAKQKVWAIVNEMAKARPTPTLRIGLYGYGNGDGPFRKFELTDDLDQVYKDLMTFKDEGWGSEHVGLVIQRATDEMKWADGPQVLKVIYVVGNETARQGEVDYSKSAPAAIAKGIIINAIYCGDTDYQAATPTWREVAKLADGQYMEIAGDGGAVVVNTPFDDELAKLNTRLNETYLAYGARGETGAANQAASDASAASLGVAVVAQRVAAKGGALYDNSSWDLVDAAKDTEFQLDKLKEAELPQQLRDLPADKRAEFVEAKAKERGEVQQQIQDLSQKREQFVQEEIKKQGLSQDKSLDEAVRRSITEQAKEKGFTFE